MSKVSTALHPFEYETLCSNLKRRFVKKEFEIDVGGTWRILEGREIVEHDVGKSLVYRDYYILKTEAAKL